MKTIEEILMNRLLYIGRELPDPIIKDQRKKFILLGVPQDIIDELNSLKHK